MLFELLGKMLGNISVKNSTVQCHCHKVLTSGKASASIRWNINQRLLAGWKTDVTIRYGKIRYDVYHVLEALLLMPR